MCAGLATVFPGSSSVESDFSSVNFIKNKNCVNMSTLTLQARLIAKQVDKLYLLNAN